MSRIVIAGITQIESIVKVAEIPVAYAPFTPAPDTIFTAPGGDAFNMSLAMSWLGDKVEFMTVVGKDQNLGIFNPPNREVTLSTNYVLPIMRETPMEVLLFDRTRKQQVFEDLKDIRDAQYDMELARPRIEDADLVVLSNANFCRPFIDLAKKKGKKIAVKIHHFDYEKEVYNEDFLKNAEILYFSDNTIDTDPFDFVREMADKYEPETIMLGQGEKGLILYDRERNTNVHYNPVTAGQVVNTAGAGNATFACFLHYYLKNGDTVEAVKKALMFSANKVGYIGTSNGFMTEDQLEQWERLIFDPTNTSQWIKL